MRRGWLAAVAVGAALVLLSCVDQAMGPAPLAGRFALNPHFASPHAGIVPINRFRLILRRLSNDSVALDTVVAIAPGDTAVDMSFTVAMFTSTERFVLRMRLISPTGDTAFAAGPDTVGPSTGSGQAPSVTVGLDYVGLGSNAAGVRFLSVDPSVFFGNTIELVAEAFDSENNPIPGTPIAYSSMDTVRARVPDARTGSVVGGTQRGLARIVATLLTGPSDTVALQVQPVPNAIVVVSGNNQSGEPLVALTQPVVVQVNGADGLGIEGVLLRFNSPQAGTFAPESAFTDAQGRAATVWTLGNVAGPQTLTVTVDGFPTVQGAASAEAVPLGGTTIALVSGDAQTDTVAATLGQPLVVKVTDRNGDPFEGTAVTFAVLAGGGSLGTQATTSDAAGLAQTTWTLGTVAGTQTVTASATGLAGSPITLTATATPATKARLAFGVEPANTVANTAIMPAVEVRIEDRFGNLVPTATDNVAVALATNPARGALAGTLTVTAAGGIAKFADLSIDNIGDGYTLEATSGTLAPATSAAFSILPPPVGIHWLNTTGGNWSAASNWSLNRVPTSSDTVFIQQGGTYTVTLDVNAQVAFLFVGGSSGTQTLAISSTTLTVDSAAIFGGGSTGLLALSGGTVTGEGNIFVEGTFDWTGGTLTGTGDLYVTAAGTLAISGGTKTLTLGLLVNQGTGIWSAGNIHTGSGGAFINQGTFDIQADVGFLYNLGGAISQFVNDGTLTRSTTTGTATISAVFANSGTVAVQTGTLTLNGGAALLPSSGSFTAETGAMLTFGGGTHSLDAGSSVAGAGTVSFTGGATTLGGGYGITGSTNVAGGTVNFSSATLSTTTNLTVSSGTLGGSGTLNVSDAMTWTGGTLSGGGVTHIAASTGKLVIDGGSAKTMDTRTLENAGTATWFATGTGTVSAGNGATFTNLASGSMSLQANAFFSPFGSGATFTNQGTLTRSVATGDFFIEGGFSNTGTLDVQTGTLRVHNGSFLGGSISVAGPAVLAVAAGIHALADGLTFGGQGFVEIAGGSFRIAAGTSATVPRLRHTAGTVDGAGTLTITDSLYWSGGNQDSAGTTSILDTVNVELAGAITKTLDNGRSFDNAGTVTWTGAGALTAGNGATFTNLLSGTVNLTADALLGQFGTGMTFTNQGTLTRSVATGTFFMDVPLTTTGTLEIQTGTLALRNGSTLGGLVSVAGTLQMSQGTNTLADGLSIGGPGFVEMSSGHLVVAAGTSASVPRLRHLGGSVGGAGTLTISDSLYWSAGTQDSTGITSILDTAKVDLATGSAKPMTTGRNFNNAGTVVWTGTGTLGGGGTTFTNMLGGTVDLQADALFSVGPFNNEGTVTRSVATGTFNMDGVFTNSGTLDIRTGTFAARSNFTHAAGALLKGTGTLDLSSAMVTGGTLLGDVAPGLSPGILGIVGAFPQDAASALEIEINGTTAGMTYDRLAVSGEATLNGALDLVTGFTPMPGDQFQVLTFGSRGLSLPSTTGFDLYPTLGTGLALDTTWSTTDLTVRADGQIVFSADSGGGQLDVSGLFRTNASTAFRVNVTDEGKFTDAYARWSPDRKRMTFTANNLLHVSTADRRADSLLLVAHLVQDTLAIRARYSPDGTKIAFECGGFSFGFTDVCTIANVTLPIASLNNIGDGTGKAWVTDSVNANLSGPPAFAWHPNSTQLAVVRDTVIGPDATSKIYLIDYNGKNKTLVTTLPIARRVVHTMDWSPDGSTLAFAVVNDSSFGAEQQIWTLKIVGAVFDTVSFPTSGVPDLRPVYSPDGSELLFARFNGSPFNIHYVVARADGTGERVEIAGSITADGGDQYEGHDWSPDGSQIVLLDEDVGNRLVYVVPSNVTAVSYLTDRRVVGRTAGTGIQDKHPSWRP